MEKFISEQLKENFLVKVFGEPYSVLKLDLAKENFSSLKQFGDGPSLVKVVGLKTAGACIKLDKPKFLLLPGNGEKPDDCGFADHASVLMWKVEKDFSTLDIHVNNVLISEIMDSEDKNFSLSVKLKDCQYSNGIFKGTVQIKLAVFGIKITENVPIKVKILEGGTIQVFNDYLGPFQVVIDLKLEALNKACVRVTAYYGGFSANEGVCTTF
ncbi:hypothetical protein [Flavobacterium mesophilum]|uniref:hypothetical protein n=1 Tax=Flavobacterium mesophilum TaxID=3143495 RepID=UPI0031CEEF05